MDNKLDDLVDRMRELEEELAREIQKKEVEFFYEIRKRKVHFTKEARARHRELAVRVHRMVLGSQVLTILTIPLVWACLLPFALLDLATFIFQGICFPIYGIPKVRRRDYIVIDRHQLSYLNLIEKINCLYCGYANGLLAYVSEMAARAEQYWCPIKHALRQKNIHSRYSQFFDYGNAEDFRKRVEEVRCQFEDIES